MSVSRAVSRRAAALRTVANIAAFAVALVGLGHLIAWMSGGMTGLGFTQITMKANAAFALVAGGAALFLLTTPRLSRFSVPFSAALALTASTVGALTLFENITGVNLGIDQLLAFEHAGSLGTTAPNRMGVPASASFLMLGIALLLTSRKSSGSAVAAQLLGFVVFVLSFLPAIGHMYGAQPLHAITRLTAIAWPTAVALLTLALAVVCARPAEGFMAQALAEDPGGVALRRWLPVMFLPVLLGWLRLAGERAGYFDAATGTALIMILVNVVLATVAWRGSYAVSRSSAALVDGEERLRLSHEAARIGAFDRDLRRDTWLWTPELEAIHGLPRGGFGRTRRHWQDCIHPDDRARVAVLFLNSPAPGAATEGEWRVVWPDGSIRWLAARWRVFTDSACAPVRIVGINTDITARKQMQHDLEATIRDLERSNRDLGQFAYICAHDLQEPLRQVQLYVQLLQTSRTGPADAKTEDYLRFILDGSRRMGQLVTAVLEYSRVGRSEASDETADCQNVLRQSLETLGLAIAESHAEVTWGPLPHVTASSIQLKQLFQNLIGNAVKFRRDGVPPVIHIACRREGDAWLFSVTDNGIGIPGEFRHKIFQMFQRLHRREQYGGTGIGLAICPQNRPVPRWRDLGRARQPPGHHLLLHAPGNPGRARSPGQTRQRVSTRPLTSPAAPARAAAAMRGPPPTPLLQAAP